MKWMAEEHWVSARRYRDFYSQWKNWKYNSLQISISAIKSPDPLAYLWYPGAMFQNCKQTKVKYGAVISIYLHYKPYECKK